MCKYCREIEEHGVPTTALLEDDLRFVRVGNAGVPIFRDKHDREWTLERYAIYEDLSWVPVS